MNDIVNVEKVSDYLFIKLGIEVTKESILPDDLHIDGVDAETLMLDLSKDFNFSLSKFEFQDYFLTERELGNTFLIFHYILRKKIKKLTFTVQHLVDVINAGEWFDPK